MQETPPKPIAEPRSEPPPPKFVAGSILRHVLVMTGTGAFGLVAIFLGDLANILFLSLLRDVEVVAAVGYASSILFITISAGIGLSIATAALVSPAIGARDWARARRLSANAHVFTLAATVVLSALFMPMIPWLMRLLGATGRTESLAVDYLLILVPALPPLAIAMTSSAVLRSVGDARRAMHITLAGAIVNTALDPVFIFALGLGIHGAAIASAISRFAIAAVGLYAVVRVHGLIERPRLDLLLEDAPRMTAIAVPAILTNIATPASNAYVTAAFAPYGDSAVAAWAIIGRIIPVAFGFVYALSGSIGPIIGQNYGAGRHERMRATLTLSLLVTGAYTVLAWLLLALFSMPLVRLFRATGETAALILLFCHWLAPLFGMLGALFVANAAFNTLGRPHYATALNWARATIGTIPFVEAGAALAGAPGVLAGNMLGGIAFGLFSVWLGYRLIDQITLAEARTSRS